MRPPVGAGRRVGPSVHGGRRLFLPGPIINSSSTRDARLPSVSDRRSTGPDACAHRSLPTDTTIVRRKSPLEVSCDPVEPTECAQNRNSYSQFRPLLSRQGADRSVAMTLLIHGSSGPNRLR